MRVTTGIVMYCSSCDKDRHMEVADAKKQKEGKEVLTMQCTACHHEFEWNRTLN